MILRIVTCGCIVMFKCLEFVIFVILLLLMCSDALQNDYHEHSSHTFTDEFIVLLSGKDDIVNDISHYGAEELGLNICSITRQASHLLNKCTCLSVGNLSNWFSLPKDVTVNKDEFGSFSPALIYRLQDNNCNFTVLDNNKFYSPAQVWGYSFLCVTVINLCSLMGMVLMPLMKKSFYQQLLMFMVSLAVGTLCANSVLVLIPECFGLTVNEELYVHTYIWKSSTIVSGVYLFFVLERILKAIMDYRRRKEHEPEEEQPVCSVKTHSRTRHDSFNMTFEVPHNPPTTVTGSYLPSSHPTAKDNSNAKIAHLNGDERKNSFWCGDHSSVEHRNSLLSVECHCNNATLHTHCNESKATVRPQQHIKSVAWMVIFGDGFHNFIDGLSIGAAFTESIMTGVSISVAVVCEELPHELGDFAILLNSGMTMRQAMCYNFLSACMCYLGLVIGILVGEFTDGSQWIFALAAGMFLYISLADMLPEMNHASDEAFKTHENNVKVFFIQNAGLIIGYGMILLLCHYSGKIDFEKI